MTLNRFHAFGVHFMGSALIALCTAALVFLVWYPNPLAGAAGVTYIFLLLLVVDVTIGPVITLIVFNPAKKARKELRRDLSIVVLLQVAALLYGMHAVFVARPVYAVFNVDRFDLVFAHDLSDEKLKKVTLPQYKSPPLFGPEIAAARSPTGVEARNEVLFSALAGGDDLPQFPQHYIAYADARGQIVERIQSIDALRGFNPSGTKQIDELIRRHGSPASGIGFLPLKGKVKDLAVILGRERAEVLEIVDLRPWS